MYNVGAIAAGQHEPQRGIPIYVLWATYAAGLSHNLSGLRAASQIASQSKHPRDWVASRLDLRSSLLPHHTDFVGADSTREHGRQCGHNATSRAASPLSK